MDKYTESKKEFIKCMEQLNKTQQHYVNFNTYIMKNKNIYNKLTIDTKSVLKKLRVLWCTQDPHIYDHMIKIKNTNNIIFTRLRHKDKKTFIYFDIYFKSHMTFRIMFLRFHQNFINYGLTL
jgi:hypothetical protein